MRVGEIWSEKDEGFKVVIKRIIFDEQESDYEVEFESIEGDWGDSYSRDVFLNLFERFEGSLC